jgi:predicted transcriptional regulator of viral defense system
VTTPENILINYLERKQSKVISKKSLKTLVQDVEHSESAITYLRNTGWLRYIINGYYYICDSEEQRTGFTQYTVAEMIFVVLNKLKIKWYLGLETALETNNVVWQGHSKLVIINDTISRKRTIQGTKVEFRKMSSKRFLFGIDRFKTKNRIIGYSSDPEKTLTDFFYYGKKPPFELLDKQDKNTLLVYLKKYPPSTRQEAERWLP